MVKWEEDWDTWEPTRDYPSAPPARSSSLGKSVSKRPDSSPLPASSTDSSAANFFQEFSAAAEEAGRASQEQTPELPYGDNPGIAALLANAQNMLKSDGPDAPGSFGDTAPKPPAPHDPPRKSAQTPGGASRRVREPGTALGAAAAIETPSAFAKSEPPEVMRTSRRGNTSPQLPGLPGFNPPQEARAAGERGANLRQGTPAPAYSEGWKSLVSGWDDFHPEEPESAAASPAQSLAQREFFQEDFFDTPTQPPAARKGFFARRAEKKARLREEARPSPSPAPQRNEAEEAPMWKSISADTPDGPTRLRVRRVGAQNPSPSPVEGIPPVALLAGAVVLSLVALGVGIGVGMNIVPNPVVTVTASPSTAETPPGDSPDSVGNDGLNKNGDDGSEGLAAGGLNGLKVAIDPGHNGGNAAAWQQVGQNVNDGRGGQKPCNTAGTATADGYAEHEFNWNVANKLKAKLQEAGAKVFLTRDSNVGVGPCVDERGAFPQKVGADVMISIHANGTANTSVHGFFAMVSDPPLNTSQGEPSLKLARTMVEALRKGGMSVQSSSEASDGVRKRSDLVTLNVAEVPAVMFELGEMRNPADAALMKSDSGQERFATLLFDGLKAWSQANRAPSASPSGSASVTPSGPASTGGSPSASPTASATNSASPSGNE